MTVDTQHHPLAPPSTPPTVSPKIPPLGSKDLLSVSGGNPNIDSDEINAHVDIYWKWPQGDDWDRLRLVRKARSPATRVEEGRRVLETRKADWKAYTWDGYAHFRDERPIPDEWNFYTVFVLDKYRVWVPVGTTSDIGIGDHNHGVHFPELLPGANIDNGRGTMHPGAQSNTLVNFLQPLGLVMDRLVSMAEASRIFMDPRKCAPRMLQFLMATYGYKNTGLLSLERSREVAFSIRLPDQGKLGSIQRFAQAVTGTHVDAYISDNLFLSTKDSSFEVVERHLKSDCGWDPQGSFEILDYQSGDTGLLPVNTYRRFYAHVYKDKDGPGSTTIKCGTYVDPETGERTFDPVRAGVPCQGWKVFRMEGSVRAGISAAGGKAQITFGADFYDFTGTTLITSMTAYGPVEVQNSWSLVGNNRGDGTEVVLIEPGDGEDEIAYAVPWVTVTDDCYVDLLVIDDGRR